MRRYDTVPNVTVLQEENRQAHVQNLISESDRKRLRAFHARLHEPFFVDLLLRAHDDGKTHFRIPIKDLPCPVEEAVAYFETHGYAVYSYGIFRKGIEVGWSWFNWNKS